MISPQMEEPDNKINLEPMVTRPGHGLWNQLHGRNPSSTVSYTEHVQMAYTVNSERQVGVALMKPTQEDVLHVGKV
jgi:hypothetical protein